MSMDSQFIGQKFKSEAEITKIILNIGISCLLMGYITCYFSTINFDDAKIIFNITDHFYFYQGFITGCVLLTAGLGGFLSAPLLKAYSRRQCFLILNYVHMAIIFGLLIQNVYSLIFFRLIQGAIAGIYTSIAPLYIKQFSPLELGSKMGTFFQMMTVGGLTLGFFNSFLLSLFMDPLISWRLIFIFPIFLLFYQTYNLIKVYPYQTPKYLLSVGRRQQARQLVQFIYKGQYVDQRLYQLQKMFLVSSNKAQFQAVQLKEIFGQSSTDLQSPIKNKIHNKAPVITYHNNSLAIFAAIHIANLQPLSGISIIIAYGAEIVRDVFPYLAKILPVFLHLEAVIACLFTIQLLKVYGRKQLYQYGCLGCGVLTLCLGYTFIKMDQSEPSTTKGIIILISLFTYRLVYGLTIGPVAFLYIPEIIQPSMMPTIIGIYWTLGSLLMTLFPIVKNYVFDGNCGMIFIAFGLFTLLSIALNHYILVQTKDRKQYEIRMEYDAKLGIQSKIN